MSFRRVDDGSNICPIANASEGFKYCDEYKGNRLTCMVTNEKEKTATLLAVELRGDCLTIPSTFKGYTITKIGDVSENNLISGSFIIQNSKLEDGRGQLKKLVIPKSVITIDKLAFSWTNISSIYFPNPKINIESGAFSYCKRLKTIRWPKQQMTGQIGERCFNSCGIEKIDYPDVKDWNQVGERCFSNLKRLKQITCPAKEKVVFNNNVFYTDNKTTLIIPQKVKQFDYGQNALLKKVILKNPKWIKRQLKNVYYGKKKRLDYSELDYKNLDFNGGELHKIKIK